MTGQGSFTLDYWKEKKTFFFFAKSILSDHRDIDNCHTHTLSGGKKCNQSINYPVRNILLTFHEKKNIKKSYKRKIRNCIGVNSITMVGDLARVVALPF